MDGDAPVRTERGSAGRRRAWEDLAERAWEEIEGFRPSIGGRCWLVEA